MALAMIPLGIYFYHYLRRVARFWLREKESKRIRYGCIALAVILSICSINVFSMRSVILLHIAIIGMVLDLIAIVIRKIQKNRNVEFSIWRKLYGCGLVPIIITVVMFSYGYWNMGHVVETHYNVTTEKNIREKGYRIALITDLHFENSMREDKLSKYCKEISEKNPDIVVLAGDIVDESTSKDGMKDAFSELDKIKNKEGIYYVYGNHDKASYSSSPHFTPKELEQAIQDSGIHILEDEIAQVNKDITIIGRMDLGFSREHGRKSVEELLKGVDKNDYLIMVDHQPVEYKENSKNKIDLELSGHTHGGQIFPTGIISRIFNTADQVYGKKQVDDMTAIVSSGIAGWGYPVRTESISEYVIIDVK
ncbi:phosphoesterase [Lachnospiraceae bacterium KM106-2]|nr:phosphoesterase [Lachnospiraceae bacterium KM106-2]